MAAICNQVVFNHGTFTNAVLVSDKITGFPGVAQEITERKISEEALLNSEERFELALKGADNLLYKRGVFLGVC